MKKDLDVVTEYAHLPQYIDQLEEKDEKDKEGDGAE